MKRLLLFIALCSVNTFNASSAAKETGFYGIYVKKMPFWGYKKALDTLAEITKETTESVITNIDLNIPVLCTWNHEEALQIKNQLLKVNCEIDIREMQFELENANSI